MGGIQSLPLSPASYDSDYVALGNADDIQKRNVGRAAVKTAAALDAVLDCILLEFVHHRVACILLKQERFKSHRTCLCAFAATDAGRLNATHSLFGSKVKER